MPKVDEQNYFPLNKQKPELIYMFRKKTMIAILVLSISYFACIVLFIPLYLHGTENCYFVLFIPLFGYSWLVTFGAKNVNNLYGFKKVSGETVIYLKKPKYGYTTYTVLIVIIFLISSLIRLVNEIKNYALIKQATSRQISPSND